MISFIKQDRGLKFERRKLKQYILQLTLAEDKILGDISIVLCSDEHLLEVNKDFLKHDYYTDIITFDYSEDNCVSGDLLISIDRVKDNARINQSSTLHEFHRVVFHGLLHLCGYGDKKPDEKILMRRKEDYYLDFFKIRF